MNKYSTVVLLLMVAHALGDIYMHNPRGSNNRLNENGNNRNNANRLFDSQNNGAGGYCYGPAMSFYEKSYLEIEWTHQHGCGNGKLYCNNVIQYMCGPKDAPAMTKIRDGSTTDTIPDNTDGPTEMTGEAYTYGMHESYDYYQMCKTRNRNTGLWIADREEEGNLVSGRSSARFTRQNNNGNRHGYECNEERDYYPYWAPSPWRDIAVITNKKEYCDFYKSESQNVKARSYCWNEADGEYMRYIDLDTCESNSGKWVSAGAWNISAPDCLQAAFSRDNHLGNGVGGHATNYTWLLPSKDDEPCIENDNCDCVLRIRYNISTGDLDYVKSDGVKSTIDGNNPGSGFIDSRYNAAKSPVTQDPIVEGSGMLHQLALNTNQYGRTFEDRSYVFHIKPRSEADVDANAKIHNLNVRGKRGNIVQVYPNVEYDFVPKDLTVISGDYIHFQWTGCDTNSNNNAGEGTPSTDRSNIVQIEELDLNLPASDEWLEKNGALFEDPAIRKRMAFLDQKEEDCLTYEELLEKNNNNENDAKQDVQNCMKLNAAETPYFDGGLQKMNREGTYYYMSSRNNNFTNRGQKAVITVSPLIKKWSAIIIGIGAGLFAAAAALGAATFYARDRPNSGVARFLNKFQN